MIGWKTKRMIVRCYDPPRRAFFTSTSSALVRLVPVLCFLFPAFFVGVLDCVDCTEKVPRIRGALFPVEGRLGEGADSTDSGAAPRRERR